MKIYKCPRCGYTTYQRNDMRKHYFRKKVCFAIHEDIPLEKCLSDHLEGVDEPNEERPLQYNKIVNEDDNEIYKCKDCNKEFTKKNSYYRHKKHYCKNNSSEEKM